MNKKQSIFNWLNLNQAKPFVLAYEGPDDPPKDPPADPPKDPPADPPNPDDPPAGGSAVKFSQDDMNRVMADERRKNQARNEKTLKQLETLQKSQGLTEAEKAELQNQIESLQTQHLTDKEKAAREKKQMEDRYGTELKDTTAARDKWQGLYTNSTIDNAIINEAAKAQAFAPDQVVKILKGQTNLVEQLDGEGKPNGLYEPKVTMPSKDDDGKDIQVELSVADAVKRMVETPEQFGNLFKDPASGGVGGITKAGGSRGDDQGPPKDPAKYKEWRKKNELDAIK